MTRWGSFKAKRVLAALLHTGWVVTRQQGSHRWLVKPGRAPLLFAFHDSDEIGPKMMAKLAKDSGLRPDDI